TLSHLFFIPSHSTFNIATIALPSSSLTNKKTIPSANEIDHHIGRESMVFYQSEQLSITELLLTIIY
ncbi:hypothetical protein, partial [Serratia fonticola]